MTQLPIKATPDTTTVRTLLLDMSRSDLAQWFEDRREKRFRAKQIMEWIYRKGARALGPKFIRRLFSEMDITFFRDFRQGIDWLAVGKFALCFFCSDVDRAKRQGLPVDTIPAMKEGVGISSQMGNLALMNQAPHPNAAKVFINWLLSRKGQLALQKEMSNAGQDAPDSLRVDISKEDVPPSNKRVEGVEYMDTYTPGRPELVIVHKILTEAIEKSKNR